MLKFPSMLKKYAMHVKKCNRIFGEVEGWGIFFIYLKNTYVCCMKFDFARIFHILVRYSYEIHDVSLPFISHAMINHSVQFTVQQCSLSFFYVYMSRDMRFPTMCYVQPAKPVISLRKRTV